MNDEFGSESDRGNSRAVRRGLEPGGWLAWLDEAEAELLDPRHPDFRSRVVVLGSGARVIGDRLAYGYEMLCRLDDAIYLLRQRDGADWTVVHCQACIDDDEYPGIDELTDGLANPRDIEQLERFLEVAETEIFPPDEYFEWLDSGGSNWVDSEWSQEIVDGEAMWVPSARYFIEALQPVLDAGTSSYSSGPMESIYIEEVFEYGRHRFIVTGDPEGGDLNVSEYHPAGVELPEGWVHPMSMMVDVAGEPVSIAYNDDEGPWFDDSLWSSDDDELEADPPDFRGAEWDLHEIRREARQMLADLRIVHNGVEIVGPNASAVLPSESPWLAFPTRASLAELNAKVGRVFVADVSGRTMAFTDNMELAVAARLSDFEPIIRITHDTVEVATPWPEAIVARCPRIGSS